jgi:hypothetical protein
MGNISEDDLLRIKMYLKDCDLGEVNWIDLTLDRNQGRAFVLALLKLWGSNAKEIYYTQALPRKLSDITDQQCGIRPGKYLGRTTVTVGPYR